MYADFDLDTSTLVISTVINFGTDLGVVICHNVISVCVMCRVGTGICVAMAMLLTVFYCLHGSCLCLHKCQTKEYRAYFISLKR